MPIEYDDGYFHFTGLMLSTSGNMAEILVDREHRHHVGDSTALVDVAFVSECKLH